jgi:hypothetical protein
MMMRNKTELAATVCATNLRLAHELAREWICLQAAVAFLLALRWLRQQTCDGSTPATLRGVKLMYNAGRITTTFRAN